ncbi:MAG TPA: universal stress protein [Solirubrobacterales bacterium]|nr:universal stress protein [Solirubrobacterales bacterium]
MAEDTRRPILIAYDGSDCAAVAIDKVAEEFGPRKAIVLVVSEGLDRVPFFGTAGVPVEPETMELLSDAAEKGAAATAEQGAERARAVGLDASTAIAEGGPIWSAIVDAAEQYDAAVIALGSRGLSGVKHALLGSVSGAVAHHSKRSIFIAHSS